MDFFSLNLKYFILFRLYSEPALKVAQRQLAVKQFQNTSFASTASRTHAWAVQLWFQKKKMEWQLNGKIWAPAISYDDTDMYVNQTTVMQ